MSTRLALEVDRLSYAPGEEVEGTIVVMRGGRCRRLEAFLRFRERATAFEYDALSLASGPLAEGQLEEGRSYRFALRLPVDALPSVATEHGELFWEVDARSDQLGRDAHARQRITVNGRV